MMCLIYGDVALGYMREEGEKSRLEEEYSKLLYIFPVFFLSPKQAWALQVNDSAKCFKRRENQSAKIFHLKQGFVAITSI